MQHHSSQRQDAAAATLVLKVVKDQEHTPAAEPFRLHVATKVQYTAATKSYLPSRRYTIDDNGGSYEGL